MEFLQLPSQQLTHLQFLNLQFLQMSTVEMQKYIEEMALSNPVIDVIPANHTNVHIVPSLHERKSNASTEADDEHDPFDMIPTDGGFEMTLERYLTMQLTADLADSQTYQIKRAIIACLDEDGYLRDDISEIADALHITKDRVLLCLKELQLLEPCGVCARNLAECIELQLLQKKDTALAIQIVRTQLHFLEKRAYNRIAKNLSVSLEAVYTAVEQIKHTNPRPGAAFSRENALPLVRPDVCVYERDGELIVSYKYENSKFFSINSYYKDLLQKSEDKELHSYLSEKMQQAKTIQDAITRRQDTVLRCAQIIVSAQEAFFRGERDHLIYLSFADVSEALGVTESTVSRALRGKYLQCRYGIFPMKSFFPRRISSDLDETRITKAVILAWIKELIEQEDSSHPLSDQQLCELLKEKECPISRRTVAKYRSILNIPETTRRKQQYYVTAKSKL